MKKLVILITIYLFSCSFVQAGEGLIIKISNHSVQETMDKFEKIVKDKGFNVVARVNHSAAAAKSGATLRPTELLIFGNPKLGTLLMQSDQSIGIDLPLKVLIWENDKGVVTLGYNDPTWLKKRHGIANRDKAFAKMSGALDKFSNAAVK